jgi:NADH-quinone oxidoreductase subunit N
MNQAEMTTLLSAFNLLVPEAILGFAACVLFLGGTFRASRQLWASVALLALVLAGLALALYPGAEAGPTDVKQLSVAPLVNDGLALWTRIIALIGGAVLVLFSWEEVPDRQAADYFGCLLIMIAGLGLTGMANELVTLFLALELISIPTYIVLYLPRYDAAAQEAAMKYFLLSVFSSALLLFGFSYLYGLGGTTNLPALMTGFTPREPGEAGRLPAIALAALVMIVAGLGFRITAVPFHFYAPDVYQGAPTAVAGLLAFLPKVAGFVALLRVLGFVVPQLPGAVLGLGGQVPVLFWILAVVTMSLGNLLALLQHNVKRLLAYSSVAHAGYMLIGLAVAYPLAGVNGTRGPAVGGVAAVLFYLVAYVAMTVGAFAVLSYLSTLERPVEMEDDLAGLSDSHPGVALLMAVFLFSLIGIPLTAGFFGKMWLFWGALAVSGDNARLFYWLAIIGTVNSAIGAWYYLRILSKMYLQTTARPIPPRRAGPALGALWICAAVTLVFGIYPALLVDRLNPIAGPAPARPAAEARLSGK